MVIARDTLALEGFLLPPVMALEQNVKGTPPPHGTKLAKNKPDSGLKVHACSGDWTLAKLSRLHPLEASIKTLPHSVSPQF